MSQPYSLTVPTALLDSMVRYIEVSSLLGKRALDEIAQQRKRQKQAAELSAPLLDYLLEVGLVAPAQKQAAASMLRDHRQTLQLLKTAAELLAQRGRLRTKSGSYEPGYAFDWNGNGSGDVRLMGPAGIPLREDGEYDSLNDPFVGRRTSFVKESDRKLLALIGK